MSPPGHVVYYIVFAAVCTASVILTLSDQLLHGSEAARQCQWPTDIQDVWPVGDGLSEQEWRSPPLAVKVVDPSIDQRVVTSLAASVRPFLGWSIVSN